MTMVGDQLFQFGGTPIGMPAGFDKFAGMWGENVWFVDFDNGSDDNPGDTPTTARKYLDTTLNDKMGDYDTVYVRPRALSSSYDFQKITPSATTGYIVPLGTDAVNIIGTSPGSLRGTGMLSCRTYLAGHASGVATSGIMTIKSGFCNIENLAFYYKHGSTATTVGTLYLYGGTSTSRASGCSIANCAFRFGSGAPGIYILDAWYQEISNCYFYRVSEGIKFLGSQSTARGMNVLGCTFVGVDSSRSVDINIYSGAAAYHLIRDCSFDELPAKSGGYAAYIHAVQSGTNNILVQNCYFNHDDVSWGTSGSDINVASGNVSAGCFDEDGNAL